MEQENELEKLEKNIGYTFKNKDLLKNALTHTSYAYEHKVKSNEKLEFLGDSILEFISSKYLYNNYPKLKEGEMTKVRATVVCEESLYKIANKHNFSDFLYVGKSEMMHQGNRKVAIMADSVEAVIAAIYFDSGLEEAEKFIIDNLKDEIEIASKNVGMKDHKTVLQEKLQVHGNVDIKYEIINETGPDHDKTFTAQVKLNGKVLAGPFEYNITMPEMQTSSAPEVQTQYETMFNETLAQNDDFIGWLVFDSGLLNVTVVQGETNGFRSLDNFRFLYTEPISDSDWNGLCIFQKP